MDRPNFLWLVSEDNSPEFVGPYNPLARTPTLDNLARDGVVYDNCFATAPVCAPSRFSIITGAYASSYAPANHMRSGELGTLPSWVRGFPAYLREVGYYCTNNAKRDYNAPIDVEDAWDESSTSAHWRSRPGEAPFFAVFNYHVTHESCLHPGRAEPLADGVQPADVELPAYHPDIPELRDARALYYDQNTKLDAQLAQRLAELDADGLADDTIVFYYADHGGVLPRSKRLCYDTGLRVPLIVRVPPKWQHLWPATPGSRVPDLVSLMDLGPTLLSLAALPVLQHMAGRPLAGATPVESADYTFGFSNRMDERYDMRRTARDKRYRYIRNYLPHLPSGQHIEFLFQQAGVSAWQRAYTEGRVDPVQAAFWEPKPVEELYDLAADPDEVRNLAGSADHQTVLERMRDALYRHMIETHDTGFIPEGSPLERYESAHDPEAYPLERVIAVAGVASQRNPANLPLLVDWLSDRAEPVRYWAAQGCVMLGERSEGARAALESCLWDTSPSIRVGAAEALCRLGAVGQGLSHLQELAVNHDHPMVRLQAINAIDHLGHLAKSARATIEKAMEDTNLDVRKVARFVLKRTGTQEQRSQ